MDWLPSAVGFFLGGKTYNIESVGGWGSEVGGLIVCTDIVWMGGLRGGGYSGACLERCAGQRKGWICCW